MGRIRTIKPEFFTSEDVVKLSPLARLLYIGLWCEADREGRFAWSPYTLKLRYLPGDDIDIEVMLAELVERRLVVRYGKGLAYIPTFAEHQRVNPREAASKLPAPEDVHAANLDLHSSNPELHTQVGKEGKGKEGERDMHASTDVPSGRDSKDPKAVIFSLGVELLRRTGTTEETARRFLGSLAKQGEVKLAKVIAQVAADDSIIDPKSYLTAAMKPEERRLVL